MKIPATLIRLSRGLIEYKRKSEIVSARPVRLWIETSTLCNLECVMCPNKDLPEDRKSVMDLDLFQKVIDEAEGAVRDVYLHHRGEPFLNPQLFSMIRYAENAGLRTRFHTNGTMLTPGRTDKLLDAAPSMVSFSVDGFSKEPYERIREGASFEKTIENIRYLAAQKRERQQKKPYVVVERIRFKHPDPDESAAEISTLTNQLLSAGVDEIIEKDEYEWVTEESPEIEAPRRQCCTFPWYAMVICADGDVIPCPQDFWAKMVMGNVRNSSLREIWNGDAYRALRRSFRTGTNTMPLCRRCDRLCRKSVGGVPIQYAKTFLIDQLAGYGKLRKLFGTAERN